MRRTVIVSGGSRGLGQQVVEAFLGDPHYAVATFSRHRTPFIDALLKDRSVSDRFLFDVIDLADAARVQRFVTRACKRFGAVGLLINNAGVVADGWFERQSKDAARRMIAVNLQGTVTLTQRCAQEMLKRRWGRIVSVSSVTGRTGFSGLAVYGLTKAGIDGLTRGLARELGDRGITVNAVAPGFLETAMTSRMSAKERERITRRTPAGRFGRTADVVPLIRFLCSDDAAFITGQTIVVDGGLTA